MRKNIGKEGSQTGEFNVMRLSEELKNISIELFEINPDTKEIYLTFADELEAQVNAICSDHIPEPLPEGFTELQQTQIALAETIEKQEADKLELQLALAEFIESTMEGGV